MEQLTPPPGSALEINGNSTSTTLTSNDNTQIINPTTAILTKAPLYSSISTTDGPNNNISASAEPLQFYINKTVTPSNSRSVVGEPSVANKNSTIFYTGNWYVARSTDNGTSWSYIDPTSDMKTFCCDQDVMYDPIHNVFAWYRQGISDSNGENIVRVGISHDAKNWWFYNISPKKINPSWINQWFDYPQLARSDKHLFFTSNMFDVDGNYLRTIIVRLPLDALGLAFKHLQLIIIYLIRLYFSPVQGATDTMHWAGHVDNSHMAIFGWNDSSPASGVTKTVVQIPLWTSQPALYECPSPSEDNNWCARSDDRILSGWKIGDHIGFFWNVDKGGPFPWPYINAAVFDVKENMAYESRPLLWSPNFAVQYAYAAPSANGKLGLISSFGGGSIPPSLAAAVNQFENTNGSLKTWNLKPILKGTHSPSDNEWGDYLRLRPYDQTNDIWIASGYTLQGGSSELFTQPRLFVFGQKYSSLPSASPSITSAGSLPLLTSDSYHDVKMADNPGVKKTKFIQ